MAGARDRRSDETLVFGQATSFEPGQVVGPAELGLEDSPRAQGGWPDDDSADVPLLDRRGRRCSSLSRLFRAMRERGLEPHPLGAERDSEVLLWLRSRLGYDQGPDEDGPTPQPWQGVHSDESAAGPDLQLGVNHPRFFNDDDNDYGEWDEILDDLRRLGAGSIRHAHRGDLNWVSIFGDTTVPEPSEIRGMLAVDAGAGDEVGVRAEAPLVEDLPAPIHHARVLEVHAIHEDPGAQHLVAQRDPERVELRQPAAEDRIGLLVGAADRGIRGHHPGAPVPGQGAAGDGDAGVGALLVQGLVGHEVVGPQGHLGGGQRGLLEHRDGDGSVGAVGLGQRRGPQLRALVGQVAGEDATEHGAAAGDVQLLERPVVGGLEAGELLAQGGRLLVGHQAQVQLRGPTLRLEARAADGHAGLVEAELAQHRGL